jgi:hypothetical protein
VMLVAGGVVNQQPLTSTSECDRRNYPSALHVDAGREAESAPPLSGD